MNSLIIFLATAASRGGNGIWSAFVNFLSNIIEGIYTIIPNYGVSIIIFTIIMRLVLLPLDLKSKKSTMEMNKVQKELQPELEKINKKYKNDPEKFNKKTMQLYEKHGVNPLGGCFGGCLPLLIQMPVTFALFGALRRISNFHIQKQSVEAFLWIKNIWAPDSPFVDIYGKTLSLGSTGWNGLFILPFLAGITSFYQSKLMSAQQPSGQEDNMKGFNTIMPIMFIWITATSTASFAIYWVTSNLFQIAQMIILNRKKDSEGKELEENENSKELDKKGQ